MQDSPERKVILEHVAKWLARDLAPVIEDQALAFRVKIAAHLVGQVCRELHAEPIADPMELAGLAAVFGQQPAAESPEARQDQIRALEARLAGGLREGEIPASDPIRMGLMQLLAGRLQVSNPRFAAQAELD